MTGSTDETGYWQGVEDEFWRPSLFYFIKRKNHLTVEKQLLMCIYLSHIHPYLLWKTEAQDGLEHSRMPQTFCSLGTKRKEVKNLKLDARLSGRVCTTAHTQQGLKFLMCWHEDTPYSANQKLLFLGVYCEHHLTCVCSEGQDICHWDGATCGRQVQTAEVYESNTEKRREKEMKNILTHL